MEGKASHRAEPLSARRRLGIGPHNRGVEPPSQGGEAAHDVTVSGTPGRRPSTRLGARSVILRFESLEGRQLLAASTSAAAPALPDLVGATFDTPHSLNWGQSFQAVGTILNQGNATSTAPFNVEVFASASPTIDANAVPLGMVTIPSGLAPHQSTQFNQTFSLPPTAVPNFSSGSPIYIDLWVNPKKQVTESNYRNDYGVGQGYDVSPVAITQQQPSDLLGSALAVSPTQASWGQTVTLTAQIRNNAQGDAPATRARLVLTPNGLNPGSAYDFTIGYINVPAVPAWQTINLTQQVTLPSSPPVGFSNDSQFTLSMAQDADFVTNPISPHVANQGSGLDMTPITITSTADTPPTPTSLPDIAPSNVTTSSKTLLWGYNSQVSATIQNLGQAPSGPFTVRFLLTGSDGSIANAIFLGQTTVPGLQPNTSEQINQTIELPSTLPSGVTLSSVGVGRVAVYVDPDQAINESLRSNDLAESSPVTLRLLGADSTSTVPTSPPIGTTLGQVQTAGTVSTTTTSTSTSTSATSTASTSSGSTTTTTTAAATSTPRQRLIAARAALLAARQTNRKLYHHTPAPHESITSKIEHGLKVFPNDVKNFFDNLINGSSSKKKK